MLATAPVRIISYLPFRHASSYLFRVVATTVQIFYAWRIWVLKQWRVVPVLIICIALVQWSATTAIGVGIANLQDISELLPFFPKTILWLGGGTCADIVCFLP